MKNVTLALAVCFVFSTSGCSSKERTVGVDGGGDLSTRDSAGGDQGQRPDVAEDAGTPDIARDLFPNFGDLIQTPDVGAPPDGAVRLDRGPRDFSFIWLEAGATDLTGPAQDAYPYDLPPPPPQGKAVDILFVVDNSNSMERHQIALVRNFNSMLDGLRRVSLGPDGSGKPCSVDDTSGCNIPDLHIGVISTDLGAGNYMIPSCEVVNGDQGKLQSAPQLTGCAAPSDPWIAYDGSSTNVPSGSADPISRVKEAFACIAPIGIQGCGFEQTIESARRALDPRLNINPGFLRQDALLVVIFITDEDDCSAKNPVLYDPSQQRLTDPLGPLSSFRCFEFGVSCNINDRHVLGPRSACTPAESAYFWSIDTHVAFFSALKPPGWTLIAAIAGPATPVVVDVDYQNPALQSSCPAGTGIEAVPAIRLKALVDAFYGPFFPICEANFAPALQAIGELVAL